MVKGHSDLQLKIGFWSLTEEQFLLQSPNIQLVLTVSRWSVFNLGSKGQMLSDLQLNVGFCSITGKQSNLDSPNLVCWLLMVRRCLFQSELYSSTLSQWMIFNWKIYDHVFLSMPSLAVGLFISVLKTFSAYCLSCVSVVYKIFLMSVK